MRKVKSNIEETLRDKLTYSKTIFRNYMEHPNVVAISGGKDSLVILDIANLIDPRHKFLKNFVHCDTTMEFPGMTNYLHNLELFYDISIEKVKAFRDFFSLIEDMGFPSRRFRWCCEVFKFAPFTRYLQENHIQYMVTGLRKEESRKRKFYQIESKNPLIPAKQINPILEWTSSDIWEYIKLNHLPYNPIYDKGFNRLGCWPCPFKTSAEWALMEKNYPYLIKDMNYRLETTLQFQKNNYIEDIENFIKTRAWTTNLPTQKNTIVGKIVSMQEGLIKLELNEKEFLNRIIPFLKFLEIIDFNQVNTNTILFKNTKTLKLSQLRIFFEKLLNCVGCGACQTLCPSNAIEIINQRMNIDEGKCTKCYECLSARKLRGACIARNYRPFRNRLRLTESQEESIFVEYQDSCKEGFRGLIRVRKTLDEIECKFQNIAIIQNYGNQKIFINSHFNVQAKKNGAYMELVIIPKIDEIDECINLVLNVLKN